MKRTHLTFLIVVLTAFGITATASAQTTGGTPTVPTVPTTDKDVSDPVDPGATDATDATAKPTAVPKPQTAAEIRDRLVFLLSGYEFFPSRDDLDKVADAETVIPILIELVRDLDATMMHRMRAIDALGFYEEPSSATFLRELTTGVENANVEASARHGILMQHHAITALARSQREEAVGDLEPFLAGSDLQLKLTAIVALGKHGQDEGRERLRTLIASDDNKHVQREARKFLR